MRCGALSRARLVPRSSPSASTLLPHSRLRYASLAPACVSHEQKFDPNAQPYWIGFYGDGRVRPDLFTDTANGYDPCSDVNNMLSTDPCCGVETWNLFAIPLPTEAKDGSRFCTGWPGLGDPHTGEAYWMSSDVGKNTTIFSDSSCTVPHTRAGETGYEMHPFETFPLGCSTAGGSLYLGMKVYTLVQSGPLTDIDKALQNDALDGMPLSAYQFRALFDHSDCSDASPVLAARPLFDPVDAWFGGKHGTLAGSLAMRDVAAEGSDFLARLGFVSESNASSNCVAASGVYGSFGAELMWEGDASSVDSSAPKLDVVAVWLDETDAATLIAAKPAATLPRRLALDARVVVVTPSGTNYDGQWGGVVLPAGVALNYSIVFARNANTNQLDSNSGDGTQFTTRDDGNVVKIFPAGTNDDSSVNGNSSSVFALRPQVGESPANPGVSSTAYTLSPGEAASFVVCTVVGWGGAQTAPLLETDSGYPAVDATQWSCTLFQDPDSIPVGILAQTDPEFQTSNVGMFSTAFRQYFGTGAWGPAGSYFEYYHSPDCSGDPSAYVVAVTSASACSAACAHLLLPCAFARLGACLPVCSRALTPLPLARIVAQLPPRDGGAWSDVEQRRVPHGTLEGGLYLFTVTFCANPAHNLTCSP